MGICSSSPRAPPVAEPAYKPQVDDDGDEADWTADTRTGLCDRLILIFFVLFPCTVVQILEVVLGIVFLPFAMLYSGASRLTTTADAEILIDVHEPTTSGKPKDTILFVHGYPDGPSIWDRTVSALKASGYRCLVVHLPGGTGGVVRKGFTPMETAELIHTSLRRITQDPVVVCSHDWGVGITAFLAEAHPTSISRLVCLDVGTYMRFSEADLGTVIGLNSYFPIMALAFVFGWPVGTAAVRFAQGVPMRLIGSRFLQIKLTELTSSQCFIYVGFVKTTLKLIGKHGLGFWSQPLVPHVPKVPTLFIYATDKRFQYHTHEWPPLVKKTPGGRVVRMVGEHWFFNEVAHHPTFMDHLQRWLLDTQAL